MIDFEGEFGNGFVCNEYSQRIRRLIDLIVEDPTGQLNLSQAIELTDEITKEGRRACHIILARLYERLYRRCGLYLTLELLDFIVRNCGLDFARYIKYEFVHAMRRLLKLSSLNEQTVAGALNSTLKMLTKRTTFFGSSDHPPPISKDVVLVRCQKKVLYLIQLWSDAFMMHEDEIIDIVQAYRRLRKKGNAFPPRDPQQRFLVKHAHTSPIFEPGNNSILASSSPARCSLRLRNTPPPPSSSSSSFSSSLSPLKSASMGSTDEQIQRLRRSLIILKSDNVDHISKLRCARICSVMLETLVEKTQGASSPSCRDCTRAAILLELQTQITSAIAGIESYHEQGATVPAQTADSKSFDEILSSVLDGDSGSNTGKGSILARSPLPSQSGIVLGRGSRSKSPSPSSAASSSVPRTNGLEKDDTLKVSVGDWSSDGTKAWDPLGLSTASSSSGTMDSSPSSRSRSPRRFTRSHPVTDTVMYQTIPLLPPPPRPLGHTVMAAQQQAPVDLFSLDDADHESDAIGTVSHVDVELGSQLGAGDPSSDAGHHALPDVPSTGSSTSFLELQAIFQQQAFQ